MHLKALNVRNIKILILQLYYYNYTTVCPFGTLPRA